MTGKAQSHARAALDRSIAEHRKVLKRAQKRIKKARPRGKQLDGLSLTEALPGTLADAETRRAAASHLIDSLVRQHVKTKGSECRTFLATFAWDEGIISADQTALPSLKPLFHKVYKALAEFGLSGVMVIDFALFDPGDGPPYIHIHIHAVCWTYDQLFRPTTVSKKLRKRPRFKNTRFKSVDIRSRKKAANLFAFKDSPHHAYLFANLHQDQTKASIAWMGQYLWAAPTVTKRVVEDAKTRKRRIANLANSENSEKLHLQVETLMSQLSVYDCIVGIDAGCAIRREWKKAMSTSICESRADSEPPLSPHFRKRRSKAKRRRSSRLLASALRVARK